MRYPTRLTFFTFGLLLAMTARAAGVSGANANVTVTCRTPGVDRIVPCGLELHATTRGVPSRFQAQMDFKANAPQQLVEPNPSLVSVAPGETVPYRTTNPENIEEEVSGSLVLFRVDVMIGVLGEGVEESVGAFIPHSSRTHAGKHAGKLRPVRIRCLPADRPGNEKIILDFPAGDLLVRRAGRYEAARRSYKANEIGSVRFFLQGLSVSTGKRDFAITATHGVNGCSDTARYTVVGKKGPDRDDDDEDDLDDDDRDDDDDDLDDDDEDDRDREDDDDDDDDDDGKGRGRRGKKGGRGKQAAGERPGWDWIWD